MPHEHKVKVYIENGHYHVYNRGVEKRDIFLDDQDYRAFLHLLKYYLSPTKESDKHPLEDLKHASVIRPRPLLKIDKKVHLLAYCLMPNHFHLLIKQISKDGMPKLLRGLSTTYAMYFNRRYKRVGYLFQGNYKAVLVKTDAYLLHLSRYIHLNPIKLSKNLNVTRTVPVSYPFSSYAYYLGKKRAPWVKPDFILSYFDSSRNEPSLNRFLSYQEFVDLNQEDPREAIPDFAID